jgi:hypothetical protein
MELTEIDGLGEKCSLVSLVLVGQSFVSIVSFEGLPTMKLAVRILAFAAIVAGAAAASFSSSKSNVVISHLSATSGLPSPGCGPGMGCPGTGK